METLLQQLATVVDLSLLMVHGTTHQPSSRITRLATRAKIFYDLRFYTLTLDIFIHKYRLCRKCQHDYTDILSCSIQILTGAEVNTEKLCPEVV